jgi:hypothetical protein
MAKNVELTSSEKNNLNGKYQAQMQKVLTEKEEMSLSNSSLEDRIQKLEMERE